MWTKNQPIDPIDVATNIHPKRHGPARNKSPTPIDTPIVWAYIQIIDNT